MCYWCVVLDLDTQVLSYKEVVEIVEIFISETYMTLEHRHVSSEAAMFIVEGSRGGYSHVSSRSRYTCGVDNDSWGRRGQGEAIYIGSTSDNIEG